MIMIGKTAEFRSPYSRLLVSDSVVAAVRSGALRRTEKTRHIDQASARARIKQPGEVSCRKKSGGRILITISATANGAILKRPVPFGSLAVILWSSQLWA